MIEDYDKFEKSFLKLLGQLRPNLSSEEQREIAEYINQNEFEAALETLVDILAGKNTPVPASCTQAAAKIAKALEMPSELTRIQKELTKRTG